MARLHNHLSEMEAVQHILEMVVEKWDVLK